MHIAPVLKQNCMLSSKTMNKLTTIREDGSASGAGTPGPTTLHPRAQHRHITNQYGVAYRWEGSDVYILALGKKHNRNTGRGDSGYDWDKNGGYGPAIG